MNDRFNDQTSFNERATLIIKFQKPAAQNLTSQLKPESKWVSTQNGLINNIDFCYLAQSRTYLKNVTHTLPKFYKDILQSWYDLRDYTNSDTIDIPAEPLWYNTRITVDKKEFFKKSWHKNGISFVYNLIDKKGKFLSHSKISTKY